VKFGVWQKRVLPWHGAYSEYPDDGAGLVGAGADAAGGHGGVRRVLQDSLQVLFAARSGQAGAQRDDSRLQSKTLRTLELQTRLKR